MRRVLRIILGASTAALIAQSALTPSMASGPCAGLTGDPPISDPVVLVGGRVLDAADAYAAIEGATVQVFVCSGGSGYALGTDVTDSGGSYSFVLNGGHYYYVVALPSGPLQGRSVASGSTNPSAVQALGDSVTDVDFAFD